MQTFMPMTTGWFPGMRYGLGLMNNSGTFHSSSSPVVDGKYLGLIEHPGEDYGSAAPLNSCNAALGLCVNLATNALYGMNCSQPAAYAQNFRARSVVHCAVYAELYDLVTGGKAGKIDCQSSELGLGRSFATRPHMSGGASVAAADSYICLQH